MLEFGVLSSGFKVLGFLRSRVENSRLRNEGLELRVRGFWCLVCDAYLCWFMDESLSTAAAVR